MSACLCSSATCPYHESDHVLNLAYNALLDGVRLEDIELRRNDEAFLDGLGAQRIPDPTTAGDFTRRFDAASIEALMEVINTARERVWQLQPKRFLAHAFIDIDGTIAGTYGQCKAGMGLSYKGIWGYAPLVISLANTREVLYLVNRPGNAVSHEGCVPWIDRALARVGQRAGAITLRGDTDFTLTGELDRWDDQGVKFIFGMDAHAKVVALAQTLPEQAWRPLMRLPRYEIATEPRTKRARVKEQIVRAKGYQNKILGWWARAWRRSLTDPTSASVITAWWCCARTSVCRKEKPRCLTRFATSSTSPTIA